MSLSQKLDLLSALYALLDRHLAPLQGACEKGCAACCTCNVTATTLEAWPLHEALKGEGYAALRQTLVDQQRLLRYRPTTTINGWARQCLRGQADWDDAPDPDWGPCPLLTDSACPLYPQRPLGCRVMISRQRCRAGGEAEMDPFVVTLSNIFGQVIEHLDRGGLTGNLTDLLRYFDGADQCWAYAQGVSLSPSEGLLANQPMPALMIAPEERQRAQPVLDAINALMAA